MTEAARVRAERVLRSMGKPSSVFPSIAPDGDGGVLIAWMASLQTISIEIQADGCGGYCHVTDVRGVTELELHFGMSLSAKRLGQALDRLSAKVRAVNPHWRGAFPS